VLEQVQLDHARHLPLGQAGLDAGHDVGQAAIEHVDRLLQAGQLFGVFGDAQVVDQAVGGLEADARAQAAPDVVPDGVRQVQ
jgi:hypothetical protein